MVRGGFARVDKDNGDWNYKISSARLLELCKTENLSVYIKKQQLKYCAHLIRQPNDCLNKQLMFNSNKNVKVGKKVPNLLKKVLDNQGLGEDYRDQFCNEARDRKF